MCVCVCVCARACVCVCKCVRFYPSELLHIYIKEMKPTCKKPRKKVFGFGFVVGFVFGFGLFGGIVLWDADGTYLLLEAPYDHATFLVVEDPDFRARGAQQILET